MEQFKQYKRKQIAELRPVTIEDISNYDDNYGIIILDELNEYGEKIEVSISRADEDCGSPKMGDMIARNPGNHNDQWLVAKQYFEDNFEPIKE